MKALTVLLLGIIATTVRSADLPPLNSPTEPGSYPGKFIWGDLFTADPTAAQKFYTGLFGWTAATIDRTNASGPHSYIVLSVAGRPIAGIVKRPVRMQDEVHGRWIGYVSVPDVARALAAATGGGGQVFFPIKDMAQRGTQAVFSDPDGAVLGVMHSSSGDPGEYLPEPGDWTWAELFARDPAAACLYYHAVAGYEKIPDRRTDKPNEFVLVSGGYSRASVTVVPDRPKARPAWLLFVRVRSVKDAVARAVSLGGRVRVSPSEAPSEYWRAVIADPTGAHIGLVELEDSRAAKEKP